jgi:two-component system response regulator HydG
MKHEPTLLGSSAPPKAFEDELRRVAPSSAPVLLVGESGTGKGVAARALHEASRPGRPLVVVHLAALSPTLVESALFGHEKGAFTDARAARAGFFRQAGEGTLVLDDVDLLPLELQPKLLRVLQERMIEPLGAEAGVPLHARIVSTTNRDLAGLVQAGRFRSDLYYRLAVVTLELPPLRVRRGDVSLLIDHFAHSAALRLGIRPRGFSGAARERLERHSWPGNVRELENAVERVLVLGQAAGSEPPAVEPQELDFLDEPLAGVAGDLASRALAHGLSLDELSRALLEAALRENRGNVSAAARQIGLTRRAFDYRLARAGRDGDGHGEEEEP